MLLDDARDKELEEYQAASTAFVSFKDARTARLVLRILDNHPKRSLACHTLPAPDWTDLLWPRLGRSVYRSELIRSWVTFFGVWAFTLAWVRYLGTSTLTTDLSRLILLYPHIASYYRWIPATLARMVGSQSECHSDYYFAGACYPSGIAHYRHLPDSACSSQQGSDNRDEERDT